MFYPITLVNILAQSNHEKMTTGIDLEGKSQLMIDFLEVREQTNDYRTNILELLESDNQQ